IADPALVLVKLSIRDKISVALFARRADEISRAHLDRRPELIDDFIGCDRPIGSIASQPHRGMWWTGLAMMVTVGHEGRLYSMRRSGARVNNVQRMPQILFFPFCFFSESTRDATSEMPSCLRIVHCTTKMWLALPAPCRPGVREQGLGRGTRR